MMMNGMNIQMTNDETAEKETALTFSVIRIAASKMEYIVEAVALPRQIATKMVNGVRPSFVLIAYLEVTVKVFTSLR
jgi:hypothetical protein